MAEGTTRCARRAPDDSTGLTYAIPWVMPEGEDLGHMQISNRKAIAAGLTFRPLLTTARDTLAWRRSDAVPEALRKQPRYVLTPEQESRDARRLEGEDRARLLLAAAGRSDTTDGDTAAAPRPLHIVSAFGSSWRSSAPGAESCGRRFVASTARTGSIGRSKS